MMTYHPRHHPAPSLVAAYATGALDAGRALLIATHCRMCPECREDLRLAESAGGAVLEAMPAAPVAPDMLTAVLAAVAVAPPRAAEPPTLPPDLDGAPEPAATAIRHALAERRFRYLGPGLRALDLCGASGPDGGVRLLRIEPGFGAPRHAHAGEELTLVLTGAFRDETGRYAAGDVATGSPAVTHRPVAEAGAICYALAVTDGPLLFTGALGLVQRALRGD